jgi:hypothetical protein
MAFTHSMILNDYYTVFIVPTGFMYHPTSDNQESMTIWLYMDGLLHKLTGAMGTWNVEAAAGSFGKINFTITGSYNDPVSADMLTSITYEMISPPQVELAYFYFDQYRHLKAQQLTFDLANTVVPREDVNAEDGYAGVLITSRKPVGTMNPEMPRLHEVNLWSILSAGTFSSVQARFGTAAGNTVWMYSPALQLSGPTYGDRENIRTLQTNMNFCRIQGDDEIFFFFV